MEKGFLGQRGSLAESKLFPATGILKGGRRLGPAGEGGLGSEKPEGEAQSALIVGHPKGVAASTSQPKITPAR